MNVLGVVVGVAAWALVAVVVVNSLQQGLGLMLVAAAAVALPLTGVIVWRRAVRRAASR